MPDVKKAEIRVRDYNRLDYHNDYGFEIIPHCIN